MWIVNKAHLSPRITMEECNLRRAELWFDKFRPKMEPNFEDFTFEAHIFFDDAFENVDRGQTRHLNTYAKDLVKIITKVYDIFKKTEEPIKQDQIPDLKASFTPYGGRLILTMPHGNNLVIHFKDKELILNKMRWSQVMSIHYLLDWTIKTKHYINLTETHNGNYSTKEIQQEERFWKELQIKYLQPVTMDKETQRRMEMDLQELRNKIVFNFFFVNGLWLLLAFILQVFEVCTIQIKIIDLNFEETRQNIQIEAMGLMLIMGSVLPVLIQFIGMLCNRLCIIFQITSLDTEPEE